VAGKSAERDGGEMYEIKEARMGGEKEGGAEKIAEN